MPYMVRGWDRVAGGCRATLLPSLRATGMELPAHWGCALAQAGALPGDGGAAGSAWGKQGPRGIPGRNIGMEEMVGVPGEDFRNWGWDIIFPGPAATSGCVGLPFVSLTHVLLCPSKTAPGKGSGKGRVGAQKPQPSSSEPTHGGSWVPSLALSRGEAAQLGLGRFPVLARGRAGRILKHFQHFLKGTAVSGARRASLGHSEGCSAGWCRHHFK